MNWLSRLNADPLPWLLEPDAANPGVRYFALKDLLRQPPGDAELESARQALMASGPVPVILDAQQPPGWWCKPGMGYGPKYMGTVWSVIFLAMLGADGREPRVRAGGNYVLDHSRSPSGRFYIGATVSAMVPCLEGNLSAALLDLGFLGDARLDQALDGLARSITGQGMAEVGDKSTPLRYFRSGNSGPGFQCSAQNHQACGWGAVKALLALGKVPVEARTPVISDAIQAGVDFLLSRDPAVADYPTPMDTKPNGSWFKFGYPLGYVTDVLQNVEALVAAGHGADSRLTNALEFVLSKQDAQGRWMMAYTYNGKMWADVEEKGKPSKWVTLRAMRVLKGADEPVSMGAARP